MNTVKSFLTGLAFVAATFGHAAELDMSAAKRAFLAWAKTRTLAGCDMSSPVESVEAKRTGKGNLFYMLRLEDGKTVFTSGTSSADPVIAFTSNPITDIDEGSPLAVLLEKDLAVRAAAGEPETITGEAGIDDIRVSPFLKTKWGQSTAYTNATEDAEAACFNLFAPSNKVTDVHGDSVTDSYVRSESGCVATAMAQIMRYWRFPAETSPFDAACSIPGPVTNYYENGVLVSNVFSTSQEILSATGGPYDWDAMTEDPLQFIDGRWIGTPVSRENREAIGKLVYDCGVSVGTQYNSRKFGGSGLPVLDAKNISDAFKSRFGYKNAVIAFNDPALSSRDDMSARAKTILSNLDAKMPVLLVITDGLTAHAAVADGYGFSGAGKTLYVHLNMGWSGQGDVWYNLPDINAADSPDGARFFSVISSACYNISPDSEDEIISGRLTDEAGNPVQGAQISVIRRNGEGLETIVADNIFSDENGIYHAFVPAGFRYKIRAEKDGDVGGGETETITESSLGAIGNSWGNDIVVTDPYVMTNGKGFSDFRFALDEANRIALEGIKPVIEILRPIHLEQTVSIGCDCIIRADSAIGNALTFSGGARLNIEGDSEVTFHNVQMGTDSDETASAVAVKSGTCVISGDTRIDVIYLKDASCKLRFAGKIENPLAVVSPRSSGKGQTFAASDASPDEIGDSAALISNGKDMTLGGIAEDDGQGGTIIVWDEVPCPEEAAVAKIRETVSGAETCFRSLDLLFNSITNDAEVVLLKSSHLATAVSVTNAVSINSASSRFDIWLEKTSLIRVKDAGELNIGNTGFVNFPRNENLYDYNSEWAKTGRDKCRNATSPVNYTVFEVTLGGRLSLSGNSVISGLECNGRQNYKNGSGTIFVDSGTVTMHSGALIENCESTYGGAIYLTKSEENSFDFRGGTIKSCKASNLGGAVYALGEASVKVGGDAAAADNFITDSAGEFLAWNNIHIADGTKSLIGISAPLTGMGKTLGISYSTTENEKPDAVCATALDGIRIDDTTLTAIFCSTHPKTLEAKSDESDSSRVVWAEVYSGIIPVPESMADAMVIKGGTTNFYETVDRAFSIIEPGEEATVKLLRDSILTNNLSNARFIPVNGMITFDGNAHTLSRRGSWTFEVGEETALTLTNIVFLATNDVAGAQIGAEAEKEEPHSGGDVSLIKSTGGSVTLESGTTIRDFAGYNARDAGAIVVQKGSVTLNEGVNIYNCTNFYVNESQATGCGGAILVDEGTAYLNGGTISRCAAYRGGGIYLANGSRIFINGDISIADNTDLEGNASNMIIGDIDASLTLTGALEGKIGWTDGISTDKNVIGKVDGAYFVAAKEDEIIASAAAFRHDIRDANGMVATNGTSAVLVWSDACDPETMTFTDGNGNVYGVMGEITVPPQTEIIQCLPFSFTSVSRSENGNWILKLSPGVAGCTYYLYSYENLSDIPRDTSLLSPVAVTNLTEDGEFTFEVNPQTARRFWKAVGEDGIRQL